MNIIITAPKHTGKSTIIKKIIEKHEGSTSGFITEFDDRASAERKLILRDLNSTSSRCAVRWFDGGYEVYKEVFDCFAPQLIDTKASLVIIDELGKFEKDCASLKAAVISAFESSCNVVASVRLDAAGWAQDIKSRDDVRVINISPENRNDIPEIILEMLG